MAENYSVQNIFPVRGATATNNVITFSRVTLTAAYTGNLTSGIQLAGQTQIMFFVDFLTHASATTSDIDIRLEFSPDNTNWYQETESSVAAGVDQMTRLEHSFTGGAASTTYSFKFAVPVADKFMRVALKQAVDVTNFGTASILMVVSGQ